MSISAQQVKELRDRTGAGMMDCKKALVETNGDMDEAIKWLQVKGISKAAKKSGRITAEGMVASWMSEDRKSAVLIEVNCETDFVSRNEQFQTFVKDLVTTIGESGVSTLEEALQLPFKEKTVEEAIKEQIATIGENIQLRRIIRTTIENGFASVYIHNGSQLGTISLVEGEASDKNFAFGYDIAMHAAGMRPIYLSTTDATEDEIAKQREIFTAQVREEGKPENIQDRIVQGKIDKWLKENSMYEQDYVKDQDITVREYEKQFGGVKIVKFERFEVGEGIEKKETNLAEEVAAQINNL